METKLNDTQKEQLKKALELIKEAEVLYELATNEIEEKSFNEVSDLIFSSRRRLYKLILSSK